MVAVWLQPTVLQIFSIHRRVATVETDFSHVFKRHYVTPIHFFCPIPWAEATQLPSFLATRDESHWVNTTIHVSAIASLWEKRRAA